MPSQAAADRILDTASKLFYQKGIRATGVDSIAAASGMTKMTLYACYGSKEELVRVYLARRDQRWREWLKDAVERHVVTAYREHPPHAARDARQIAAAVLSSWPRRTSR